MPSSHLTIGNNSCYTIYLVFRCLFPLTYDSQPPGGECLVWVGGDLAAVEAGQGLGHIIQSEQEPGGRGGQDLYPRGQCGIKDVRRGPVMWKKDL